MSNAAIILLGVLLASPALALLVALAHLWDKAQLRGKRKEP